MSDDTEKKQENEVSAATEQPKMPTPEEVQAGLITALKAGAVAIANTVSGLAKEVNMESLISLDELLQNMNRSLATLGAIYYQDDKNHTIVNMDVVVLPPGGGGPAAQKLMVEKVCIPSRQYVNAQKLVDKNRPGAGEAAPADTGVAE